MHASQKPAECGRSAAESAVAATATAAAAAAAATPSAPRPRPPAQNSTVRLTVAAASLLLLAAVAFDRSAAGRRPGCGGARQVVAPAAFPTTTPSAAADTLLQRPSSSPTPALAAAVGDATDAAEKPGPYGAARIGVAEQARCFQDVLPVPPAVAPLQGTYWDVYIDFGRRWSALPVCPAKATPWRRASERYEGGGGFRESRVAAAAADKPTVVLCATIAANEEAFIREWAVYHLLLGVSRLNVYPINRAQRDKLRAALAGYDRERVWIHPVQDETDEEWLAEGGRHVSFEKRTIAHCYRERLNASDVVLHIDVDEYLYPGVYRDIPTLFAAELPDAPGREELAFCVRYMGYGADAPLSFPPGTLYLERTTHSGAFCSNSKTGGMSRCVKKPKEKVRRHFVHELPLTGACRSDPMIGVYLKKVPPTPCCRPSYFVAHMQHRDFVLDAKRRRREVDPRKREAALKAFQEYHTMTVIPDTRMNAYGHAVAEAVAAKCFLEGTGQVECPVVLPTPAPPR